MQLDTDLKAGERLSVLTAWESNVYEVEAVRPGAFKLKEGPKVEKVFVYGREVDDFHAVDYTAVAMLNVSATQELYKQLTIQGDKIEEQQSKIQYQEEGLNALKAENQALRAEFENLKAMVIGRKAEGVSSMSRISKENGK